MGDRDNLPQLPKGWVWATFEQVSERVTVGHVGSMKNEYIEDGISFLRSQNVCENRFDPDGLKFISRKFHLEINFTPEEFKIYQLAYGDILLNEGQSLEMVGRPAIYRNEVLGACFQNTLVRFRVFKGLIPEYALCVFRAYLHNGRFQRIARWTTNIAHLGGGRFAELEFPLPSLSEQHAIVTEVERCLSIIKELEKILDNNLKRTQRLRQSILKKAFEGKLVPQDPTDEPADKLLERIKAEKAKREAEAKAKKKQKQPGKSQQLELF
jgi:type I restriction enzyme S subunit